jgi:hypothetical protein
MIDVVQNFRMHQKKCGNIVIIVPVRMLRRQKHSMDFDKIWFRGFEFWSGMINYNPQLMLREAQPNLIKFVQIP